MHVWSFAFFSFLWNTQVLTKMTVCTTSFASYVFSDRLPALRLTTSKSIPKVFVSRLHSLLLGLQRCIHGWIHLVSGRFSSPTLCDLLERCVPPSGRLNSGNTAAVWSFFVFLFCGHRYADCCYSVPTLFSQQASSRRDGSCLVLRREPTEPTIWMARMHVNLRYKQKNSWQCVGELCVGMNRNRCADWPLTTRTAYLDCRVASEVLLSYLTGIMVP